MKKLLNLILMDRYQRFCCNVELLFLTCQDFYGSPFFRLTEYVLRKTGTASKHETALRELQIGSFIFTCDCATLFIVSEIIYFLQ